MEILKVTKRFQGRRDFQELFASQGAYMRLSNEDTEEHKELCQVAFEISVDRGYSEMIHNLILTKSDKISVTWTMIESFIEIAAMNLVKDAIKYGLRFRDGENSLSKKLFLSQTS